MKKIIGSLLLVVFGVMGTAHSRVRVRPDVLAKAEEAMGSQLESRLLLSHTEGPNGKIGWWDGGRAAVEAESFVRDIKEFQALLTKIEQVEKKMANFSQVPQSIQDSINARLVQVSIAIDAMPFKYSTRKELLRSYLLDELISKSKRGFTYKKTVSNLNEMLDAVVEQYQNEFALKNGNVKHYSGELAALETSIRFNSMYELTNVAKKFGLNNAELEQIILDLESGKGGFSRLHQTLRVKFSFQYYGIKFYEILKARLFDNAQFLRKTAGYDYVRYSRSADPDERFDREDLYREETTTQMKGEWLPVSARVARLSAVLKTLKL